MAHHLKLTLQQMLVPTDDEFAHARGDIDETAKDIAREGEDAIDEAEDGGEDAMDDGIGRAKDGGEELVEALKEVGDGRSDSHFDNLMISFRVSKMLKLVCYGQVGFEGF
jgi:hypothetical protein